MLFDIKISLAVVFKPLDVPGVKDSVDNFCRLNMILFLNT